MDRGRADAEVSLHVGFGWRATEHQGVGVDEGQILTLLRREAEVGSGSTLAWRRIHLCPETLGASMNVRYRVDLSQAERAELTGLLSGGKHAARKLKRAQILLAADAGAGDEDIAVNVAVGGSTVYRTKRRFVEGNLEAALSEGPRPGAERKLSCKEQALLVATAVEGRRRLGVTPVTDTGE